MISAAIDKVGKDGVITVEESQTFGMHYSACCNLELGKLGLKG